MREQAGDPRRSPTRPGEPFPRPGKGCSLRGGGFTPCTVVEKAGGGRLHASGAGAHPPPRGKSRPFQTMSISVPQTLHMTPHTPPHLCTPPHLFLPLLQLIPSSSSLPQPYFQLAHPSSDSRLLLGFSPSLTQALPFRPFYIRFQIYSRYL